MGNREALLAGAKRLIYEKGFARTTARDVATASGVSLAAIGYHFGSLEALLSAALIEAIEEWSEESWRALSSGTEPDAPLLERFEAIWSGVIESFAAHRKLWAASVEIAADAEHVPAAREYLAAGLQEGRLGLAQLFLHLDPADDEPRTQAVGSFFQALMSGLVVQWLIDPQRAPSAADLTEALRYICAQIAASQPLERDELDQ